MNDRPEHDIASLRPAIYFDGMSSRRRTVALAFRDQLEINEDERPIAAWSYADIRRADSPSGTLRVTCLTAPALARLEIRDAALAAELTSRCTPLDWNIPGRGGVAKIIGSPLPAAVLNCAGGLFVCPPRAGRLQPLRPQPPERAPAPV